MCRSALCLVVLLSLVLPLQAGDEEPAPVPPSEIIGVLVQFVAGTFGDLEFNGEIRLQNLGASPCFVELRFGVGGGQAPPPLMVDGALEDDIASAFLGPRQAQVIQVTTAEPGSLFRGSVLARSGNGPCTANVSVQGGYEIRNGGSAAQGSGAGIIEVASVRPGSRLEAGSCISGPLPARSTGGFAAVGGLPFTRLTSGARLRIDAIGDVDGFAAVGGDRSAGTGLFQAHSEQDLFSSTHDPSAFGTRRLQVCLWDAQPGESVYVQLGEFQTDRTGNVQTAQPATDRTLPCESSANTLCLNQGRFQVKASGPSFAFARPLNSNIGVFNFLGEDDLGTVVSVVDACENSGHYWVSIGSIGTEQFTITVTDVVADTANSYANPPGQAFQPVFDTTTFDTCP